MKVLGVLICALIANFCMPIAYAFIGIDINYERDAAQYLNWAIESYHDPKGTGMPLEVQKKRIEYLKRTLALGANPNDEKVQPLLTALKRGYYEIASLLIEAGANPRLRDHQPWVLGEIARQNYPYNDRDQKKVKNHGLSPIFRLSSHCDDVGVYFLLKHHADPNDGDGVVTPLKAAEKTLDWRMQDLKTRLIARKFDNSDMESIRKCLRTIAMLDGTYDEKMERELLSRWHDSQFWIDLAEFFESLKDSMSPAIRYIPGTSDLASRINKEVQTQRELEPLPKNQSLQTQVR